MTYLNNFRSGLKSAQSKQILALLTREKAQGNITSLEEFKARLAQLTAQLTSTTIAPTLQLYLAELGDVIDSDSFNFMLQRIEDDLQSGFTEANTIDEVLIAHETIIDDVVIKTLELAINDLESRIESLEFISNSPGGFSNVSFNTFRVTQNNKSSIDEGIVFIDPKTQIQSGPGSEAFIDFIGEKLLLKNSLATEARINSIRQIFDAEAIQSELNVEFNNSDLHNISDSTVGTFWIQSILLSQSTGETGVFTKLELDLGSVQSLNYLQVEPVSLYPIELYRISYIDENNQSIIILEDPIEINTTNKFYFNKISARKIHLTFRNKNYSLVQFEQKPDSPLVAFTRDPLNSQQLISSVQENLLDLISSPRVRQVLGINESEVGATHSFFEYLIGFDNIRLGLIQFDETSIWVSKTQTVDKLGQVALRVVEKRPVNNSGVIEYTTNTQPSSLSTIFHGALEYYLIKRDFNKTNTAISTLILPILPVNQSVVRHEQLILNQKSSPSLTTEDIGTLQFFTSQEITDIHVYRNNTELPPTDLVVINPLEEDGWLKNTTNSIDNPGQASRMKYCIQIQRPSPVDIYTVSYTPDLSTSNTIPQDLNTSPAFIVDLAGNLDSWLGKQNTIYFQATKKGEEISYSLINLVVIMHRTSSNATLSPVLEEYLLSWGSRDNRFGGETS